MSRKKTRAVEIPLSMESFNTAFDFIQQSLKHDHISDEIISETMLMFEALFYNLTQQFTDQGTLLTLKIQKSFGEFFIKLGFEGRAYIPIEKNPNDNSPEARILQNYSDKIDYRYSSGYNLIRVVIKRSFHNSMLYCFLGILLAILVYIPINAYMNTDTQLMIEHKIVFPLLQLFANAMLMIGAPVTFFSMIKNFSETYILSERSSAGRRLQMKTIVTSIICIALAIGFSSFAAALLNAHEGYLGEELLNEGIQSTSELISSLVPASVFEPFETYMPFPIIFVALLFTYALCSISEHFGKVKKVIDICYALFSKMLNVVMFALPFFCFLAIITPLLSGGFGEVLPIIQSLVMIVSGLLVIFVFYLIRLRFGGVKILPFLKRMPPLIRENFRINSAIDAVPFNIRYCVRNFGFDRKRLSEKLPILAQTNLDGNCFIIMLIAMILIFLMGIDASWFQIFVIGILVLFLSFGAPNQPGSILIGTLIILFYLHAEEMISVAVYLEVFFGSIQNIVNVTGDIVTVAIEEQKA